MVENPFLLAVTSILVIVGVLCLLGMSLKMWMRHRAWTLGWNDGSSGAETASFEPDSNFLSYTIGFHEGLAARAQAAAKYEKRS